jgi:hypothetical protein
LCDCAAAPCCSFNAGGGWYCWIWWAPICLHSLSNCQPQPKSFWVLMIFLL